MLNINFSLMIKFLIIFYAMMFVFNSIVTQDLYTLQAETTL